MRKHLVLIIALFTLASFATKASEREWTPDTKDIAKLESVVDLSKAKHIESSPPAPLAQYTREYAGVWSNGRRMIRGAFLLGAPTGVRIVPEKSLTQILDGGCSVINLLYDAEADKILWIDCNGVA
jgi:hypothetical protein